MARNGNPHSRKITKLETRKPGDRYHLRGAHRGRREEHRACSGIVGLPEEEESWMKTKSQGRVRNAMTREMRKGPERTLTEPPSWAKGFSVKCHRQCSRLGAQVSETTP